MVSFTPEKWQAPEAPGLVGPYEENDRLASARLIPTPVAGPEDVAVGPDGELYTGTEDGSLLRVTTGGDVTTVATVGGRPLGIERYGDDLLVCNADLGLQRVTTSGTVEVLADRFQSSALQLTNNASVAGDGTIYFTESSQRWPLSEYTTDVVEGSATGRLLRRSADGELTELVTGLAFANGVALDGDEASVFVAETARYRIHRHWLTGDKAGHTEVFLDNLPGFPDNLTFADGTVWVGYASPRNPQVDAMSTKTWMKHIAVRLPAALQPKALRHGLVVGYDTDGNVTHNLQDPGGTVAITTSARVHNGSLYIGMLEDANIAVIDL
ncbi:MAG: SMP-30/gluconolactonase/LRE family protein [Actinomycetota bacterium]